MRPAEKNKPNGFTPYQKFVVGSLAFLQFAVILDFMIVAPLGALVMPALGVSPRQFGLIVSAYAFSAGASGLLVAGFADRYDRKKLLLVFYAGFVLGTLWCGLAHSFHALLAAPWMDPKGSGYFRDIYFRLLANCRDGTFALQPTWPEGPDVTEIRDKELRRPVPGSANAMLLKTVCG